MADGDAVDFLGDFEPPSSAGGELGVWVSGWGVGPSFGFQFGGFLFRVWGLCVLGFRV